MSRLQSLCSATNLSDVAKLLSFQPKGLSYVLYKKGAAEKYHQFPVPKQTGGYRIISAPADDLKSIQSHLSELLQDCVHEINLAREINSHLAHGFKRDQSIITNARVHRNRRFVFNVDIEDFFGTINFGRVRGFFLNNRHFDLHPKVATILAQIACYDNSLPQGSPCSPVISNLVTHPLDIRLAELAGWYGCTYSRYADDLTFSTNQQSFPKAIAVRSGDDDGEWMPGRKLRQLIRRGGFSLNSKKTRMQYYWSRQDVTGLVVNRRVNTKKEYRKSVRAMAHSLFTSGEFYRPTVILDKDGKPGEHIEYRTLDQLSGMLAFVDNVNHTQELNHRTEHDAKAKFDWKSLSGHERLYSDFLFYRNFFQSGQTTIVCEGKTDSIYLRAAIKSLAAKFPGLAAANGSGAVELLVRFLGYTKTVSRLLGLSGGTGDFKQFLATYKQRLKRFTTNGLAHPVIMLVDNDDGAKAIFSVMATAMKAKGGIDGTEPFYHITDNLYAVPTPLGPNGEKTMIEDFFEKTVKDTKIRGKSFNPSNTGFDKTTEYGKFVFAEEVIKKNAKTINFEGFADLLSRIAAVQFDYSQKLAGKP